MPRHRCNACERWFELARVYRDGRDIEAVLEAKRKLRDEPDECYWKGRVLKEWRDNGEML
jgi:hypothetical protein